MNAKHAYEDGFGGQQDAFYEALICAHEGLSDEQSHRLNARLVLLMANRIGDLADLRGLIETARSYE